MPNKKTQSQTQSKYRDDDYVQLKNEFEQIQQCIGMYITHTGTQGAFHLLKEIGNNALDECINDNSPANTINFVIDEHEQSFIIEDNGRGLPLDMLIDVCTKKHVSTKFGRKYNKYSTGQNGVGIKVTVALSDYFSLTSYRGEEYQTIEFIDCDMKLLPVKKSKNPQYGTIVKFVPSRKYLGDFKITNDMVLDWLRRMSYLVPQDITMNIEVIENGKKIKRTYKKEPIASNVNYLNSSLEFNPITIGFESEHMDMEVAFSYSKYIDDMLVDSYCNYAHTIDGGTHSTAAERAICDFFTREARKLDENSKFEVTYDDCRKGLIMAVNCKHDDPKFGAQAKEKVENNDILSLGRKELANALRIHFDTDSALLRKIVTYLRQMAKIRMDAHKEKGIDTKKPSTFLDDAEITGFWNTSIRNGNGYRELIITEGDSAANAILKVRNPEFQAIFKVQGVINNAFDVSNTELMQKPIIRNLVKVLGCGIGKDFSIEKLKWSKVIIMTDADIDGHYITSLLSAFFIAHLPEIVMEGRLYKSLPPLYLLSEKSRNNMYKNTTFLFDKSDYRREFFNAIAGNIDVIINKKILNKNDIINFLTKTSQYLMELNKLVKRAYCLPVVLEIVCQTLLESNVSKTKTFKQMIEKKLPEMTYNEDTMDLSGAYKSESISLIIDDLFISIAKRFTKMLSEQESLYVKYKGKNSNSYEEVTIGEFLNTMGVKYALDIDQRFKGLGEIPDEYQFIATLNPHVRKLLRFTIGNMNNTMDIMSILHSKGSAASDRRKDMLVTANITYDDIDN